MPRKGTLEFKVDWPALSKEIASHTEVRLSPGALQGMQILNNTLYLIGKLAVDNNDTKLAILLEKIGVVNWQK